MSASTTDRTYNGWTNYETWAVALWMDNEEGSYTYWRDLADECRTDNATDEEDGYDPDAAAHDLAERMKSEFEDGRDELLERARATSSLWADLLGAALSEVNWHEIALHLIEE